MATTNITSQLLLPFDLVEEILARLPVKSLKRFECVSKSWCSLIRSPEFITAHYSCTKSKATRLLVRHVSMESKHIISLLSNHTQTLQVVANSNSDIPHFVNGNVRIVLVGCCNGILCLRDYNFKRFLFWNPASKQSRIVTPGQGDDHCDPVIAFGYDSKTDEYKLVVVIDRRVKLYNMTSHCWRDIDEGGSGLNSYPNVKMERDNQVYTNGFCHFWGIVDDKESVLSFDLSKQAFTTTTPLPKQRNIFWPCAYNYLFDMNGSMGVMRCHDLLATDRWYEVWVLGEVGVRDSWAKLYTFGPISCVYRPLSFGNGEFFFGRGNHIMVVTPSSKQKIRSNDLDVGFDAQITMYAESLVSL